MKFILISPVNTVQIDFKGDTERKRGNWTEKSEIKGEKIMSNGHNVGKEKRKIMEELFAMGIGE